MADLSGTYLKENREKGKRMKKPIKGDELGERMKKYENITRTSIPPRTYTVIRLDGKAFHTYLKGFNRPYDLRIMRVMDNTAIALCQLLQHVRYAYVQSDEIS